MIPAVIVDGDGPLGPAAKTARFQTELQPPRARTGATATHHESAWESAYWRLANHGGGPDAEEADRAFVVTKLLEVCSMRA